MHTLKILAVGVVAMYLLCIVLLYIFQTRLIFAPEKLNRDHKFKLGANDQEVFLNTEDGQKINGLFYRGSTRKVILYLHGNAGSLAGWQYVAEDFVKHGYNILLIDYRGYGKSTGDISEQGFSRDAQSAYDFLRKEFGPNDIFIYGRSIGTGVAVDLASNNPCKGLILEAPYVSLASLANEKLPLFFPGLFLKNKFDNKSKINKVSAPVLLIHGSDDTLIPPSHSRKLYEIFHGRKKLVVIANASHNDLNSFPEYHAILAKEMPELFDTRGK